MKKFAILLLLAGPAFAEAPPPHANRQPGYLSLVGGLQWEAGRWQPVTSADAHWVAPAWGRRMGGNTWLPGHWQ